MNRPLFSLARHALATVSRRPVSLVRLGVQQRALLSFTHTPRSAVTSELSRALTEEIAAEKALEASNKNAEASFSGWKVATKEAEVRLTKKNGNEEILVVFNVNHSVDIEEDEAATEGNEPPQPVALPPFTVEITKGGERLCFHLDVVENPDDPGEYDFSVDEFYVAPAASNNSEDVEAHVYASSGRYIDEKLHDLLFVRFLEERGIDPAFCQTLVQYATAYEHSQYVGLLNRIKTFISK